MNKQKLKDAIDYIAGSDTLESDYIEKRDIIVRAAQAYLSLMDDVEALKEARGKATGGIWRNFWRECKLSQHDGAFITLAANTIAKWGKS